MSGTVPWANYFEIGFGLFFSMLILFFVLEMVIASITLATEKGNAKATEQAYKTFEAGVKGLIISLGAGVVLNSIFIFFGINTNIIANPFEFFGNQINRLETCIRDYGNCR